MKKIVFLLAISVGFVGLMLQGYQSASLKKSQPAEAVTEKTESSKPLAQDENKTESSKPTSPIIVIDICSLRKDHMSGFGYSRDTTPNLDAFMKESAIFDDFWTQANFCLPNFATLLTGTRTETHKMLLNGPDDSINTSKLSRSLETLAEILKEKGFKTAGFSGSRFLETGVRGLERGFEVFRNPYSVEKSVGTGMGMISFEENLPAVRTWLEGVKNDPFFLYVTIDDIHSPYHADDPKLYYPDYKGVFDKIEPNMLFAQMYNGEDASNLNESQRKELEAAIKEYKKDPENNLKYIIARYDAAVKRADRLTGELFDELKKNGLWDKSTIIVTVHQGELLGDGNLLGHTQGLQEPILSVPLFVKYPGISGSEHLSQLVERVDIPATILDMEGILSQHKQFSGKSFLPLLINKNATWEKPYAFASSKPVKSQLDGTIVEERAVRDSRYKLIWYGYKKNKYELYDLQNDPKEEHNLVNSLPNVFNELKKQLDGYIKSFPE